MFGSVTEVQGFIESKFTRVGLCFGIPSSIVDSGLQNREFRASVRVPWASLGLCGLQRLWAELCWFCLSGRPAETSRLKRLTVQVEVSPNLALRFFGIRDAGFRALRFSEILLL